MKDSRLGRFYLLPKIHKGLSSVKGRPVDHLTQLTMTFFAKS